MGYVYIVQAEQTDFYKVGMTERRVEDRLREIQTGSPYTLVLVRLLRSDDPAAIEKYLHIRLKKFRKRGEWFEIENIGMLDDLIEDRLECSEILNGRRGVIEKSLLETPRYKEAKAIAGMPNASFAMKVILILMSLFMDVTEKLSIRDVTDWEKIKDFRVWSVLEDEEIWPDDDDMLLKIHPDLKTVVRDRSTFTELG